MLQKCSSYLCLLACLLVLSACSSGPKKPPIIIDRAETPAPIVLTEQQKSAYLEALGLLEAKRYSEAEIIFIRLLEQEPTLTGALVNLGVIKKQTNKQDEAETYFAKALAINSNFIDALLQQALIHQDKGEFFKAEALLRKAEAIKPEHPLVNYNLGVLYELYLQEYPLAIQYYKRYVSLSSAEDVETVKRWIRLLERK